MLPFGSVVRVGLLRGPAVSLWLGVPAEVQEHAWSATTYPKLYRVPHLLNGGALKQESNSLGFRIGL